MVNLPQAKKRLLIVDDDEGLRELFRYSMEKEGFAVGEAADGVLGLQQAQEFEPDLIVVDLMMPNLNGFEMIRNLQVLGLGKIPVVVVTAYSDQAGGEMARSEPNVIGLLPKPVNLSDFARFAREQLSKKS